MDVDLRGIDGNKNLIVDDVFRRATIGVDETSNVTCAAAKVPVGLTLS